MSAVAVQSFGFGEQLVRAIERDGEAWFVANDVCAALEIGNSRDAVARLDEDEKGVVTTDTLGGRQEMKVISESGVYSLTFTSRKAAAKAFKRWITHDVLPALRTTGRYEMAAPVPVARVIDLENALGTADDRHAIKTALLTINTYKDLYGPQAGREMLMKLGFPVPGVDLPIAPAANEGGVPVQVEGDLLAWGKAAGLKSSKRDATSTKDLYERYVAWCSTTGAVPMPPQRHRAMLVTLFGHEEHPEMIQVVMTRR